MLQSKFCVLALGAALLAVSAAAETPLVPQAQPASSSGPSLAAALDGNQPPSFGAHFAVAAGAGAVGAPLGLLIGLGLANLTIVQLPALVLALLPIGFVAPTLSALAGWLFGNWNLTDRDGRYRFWLAWGATTVIHIAATVIGVAAGLTLANLGGVLVYALVDGAAMSAAGVGTMRLFRAAPKPLAVIPSFVPSVSATTLVPLSSFAF